MIAAAPVSPRCTNCRSRLNSWVVRLCMKCQLATPSEKKFRERTGA